MSKSYNIPEQTCCPENLQKIPDCKEFGKIYEHKIRLDNHKGHRKKHMCIFHAGYSGKAYANTAGICNTWRPSHPKELLSSSPVHKENSVT